MQTTTQPIIKCAPEKVEVIGCDFSPSGTSGEITTLPENNLQPDTLPAQSDDEIIQWLASLKPLEYERVRIERATLMNCRPAVLDSLVKAARNDESKADHLPFVEVEPYPYPINPAQLLNEVSDTICKFIVLDAEQADAMALWCAFTWFIDDVKIAPLAIITAPEHECGKSLLRDLLAKIVLRPVSANNMKPATLFRMAEKWHPSLMLDEVDLMIKDDSEIINLVNAGHHRGACEVWRLVGDNHEPKAFNVWGAKCFAGIMLEKLFPPSTLSRAIVIKLRRKLPHESVSKLSHAPDSLFEGIASKLARFAADYSQQVGLARPTLPDALGDRAQDNWEPLLAIAGCAGAEWVRRATGAALKLSGASEKSASSGNELLADIQQVFESKRIKKISTEDLIAALIADDEKSWTTYNHGKPITPRQVARQLTAYGIAPKTIRLGVHKTLKGFELSQFSDVFARYLSKYPSSDVTPSQASNDAALTIADRPPQKAIRHNAATSESTHSLGCDVVTDKTSILEGTEAEHPNFPLTATNKKYEPAVFLSQKV